MVEQNKARAVGFNHVALEVGDIEEALAFYGRLFELKLRSKSKTAAFINLSRSEKGVPKALTTVGISASLSTIRKPSARPLPRRA
jgi:predicted enzyme related to lactoylglutathione lyase